MKNYVMLGLGYVSGKHLDAIKQTGGELVAYHDIHDVVGHVDSRFINARFYREFLHFDCAVDRLQRSDSPIDYCVICLPNHLHNPACHWALSRGMDVIVEKPLVLHEKNLDELALIEERTGKKINTILQMRLHECAGQMRQACQGKPLSKVGISYGTPRGPWFNKGSWKADDDKTGGLAAAIGVHLLDLCCDVFGDWVQFQIDTMTKQEVKGWVGFRRADMEFELSIRPDKEPQRLFMVNGIDYDFTNGFGDLHTKSYQEIIHDRGFGIEDARQAIRLVEAMRNAN